MKKILKKLWNETPIKYMVYLFIMIISSGFIVSILTRIFPSLIK